MLKKNEVELRFIYQYTRKLVKAQYIQVSRAELRSSGGLVKTWIAKPQLQSNYFGKSRVGPETALLTSSQMVVMLLV